MPVKYRQTRLVRYLFNLLKKMMKVQLFQINFEHFNKQNGVYNKTHYGNAVYNFCDAMDGKLAHNVAIFLINVLQVVSPSFVHICPYYQVVFCHKIRLIFF